MTDERRDGSQRHGSGGTLRMRGPQVAQPQAPGSGSGDAASLVESHQEPQGAVGAVHDEPVPMSAMAMVGRIIADRYRIDRLLAQGRAGLVYAGWQLALGRPVAIKCIHRNLMASEESVERFLAEARLLGALDHPNILRIYDVGRVDAALGGQLFLAMELLTGSSLASILAVTPTPPVRWVREVVAQIAVALGDSHAAGIVHGDLQPRNIVLQRDRRGRDTVKVVNFGITKRDALGAERARHFVAEASYLAPEQILASPVDARTDVYALGVLLFEMLAGQPPFGGASPQQVFDAHLQAPRPDPRLVAPGLGIPDDLAVVCMSAMAIEPHERFSDAASLARAVLLTGSSGLGLQMGDFRVGAVSEEVSSSGPAASVDAVARHLAHAPDTTPDGPHDVSESERFSLNRNRPQHQAELGSPQSWWPGTLPSPNAQRAPASAGSGDRPPGWRPTQRSAALVSQSAAELPVSDVVRRGPAGARSPGSITIDERPAEPSSPTTEPGAGFSVVSSAGASTAPAPRVSERVDRARSSSSLARPDPSTSRYRHAAPRGDTGKEDGLVDKVGPLRGRERKPR